jgi:2',3'-cyclic-nucleotide 2'-phosphodiesterase (5'-nucleotidase family)
MPFWFRPEFTRGLSFQYPVEPVRRAIAKARSEGANAIVLAGHMGLKARTGGDDFANNVMSLTSEFPQTAAFIAGHTHQPISSRMTNNVLLTQADHFGIHVGRLDLVFERRSKKLVHRQAQCELMDNRFRGDAVVLSRTKTQRAESAAAMGEPIGELSETLHVRNRHGEPSEVERLIGAAIMESLRERGSLIDGVMHGLFDEQHDFVAGRKSVQDIWKIIPFENYIVTARLAVDEIKLVMEETYTTRERRSLLGFNISTEGRGDERQVTSITRDDGQILERAKKYVIAFNTFDSRSAGHRFMKLRALLETPATSCAFHHIQTRDALIEYFRRHRIVHKIAVPRFAEAA